MNYPMPTKLASPSPFVSNIQDKLQPSTSSSCLLATPSISSNTASSSASIQPSVKINSKLYVPKRSKVTRESLRVLNFEFEKCQNPQPEIKKRIALQTNLSERTVRIWFQNKRAKTRKEERDRRHRGYNVNPSFEALQKQQENISNNHESSPPVQRELTFANFSDSNLQQLNHVGKPHTISDKVISKNSTKSAQKSKNVLKNPTIDMGKCVPFYINSHFDYIDSSCIIIDKWQRVKNEDSINLQFIPELLTLSPQDINKLMAQSLDLVIIISKKSARINYFFSSISNGKKVIFRIHYPLSVISFFNISNSISDIESPLFKNEFNSEISLLLSEPPSFEINFVDEQTTRNTWIKTGDFSVNKQVQNCFSGNGKGNNIPHKIIGRTQAIMHLYDYLHNNQSMFNSHAYSNLLNYSTSNFMNNNDIYHNLCPQTPNIYGISHHNNMIPNFKSHKQPNDNVHLPPSQQQHQLPPPPPPPHPPISQHRFSISYPPTYSFTPSSSFPYTNNQYQHRQSLPNLSSEYFYPLPSMQPTMGNDSNTDNELAPSHSNNVSTFYENDNSHAQNNESHGINPSNITSFTNSHIQQFQRSISQKQIGSLSSISSANSLSLNDYSCESFKGTSIDVGSSSKCSSMQPHSPYSGNTATLFNSAESSTSSISTFARKVTDNDNQMNGIQEEDHQPDEMQQQKQQIEQEQQRDCDSPSISKDYLNINKDNIVSDLQN